MAECDYICKLCDKLVISTGVSVVTVSGTDTLVIDIPAGIYGNGCKYCIVVAQAIPTTATITMPVAISIGGVTTTVYPLTHCNCAQVVACQIRTRTRYSVRVSTSATGGVFRVLGNLPCAPNNLLSSIPVATVAAAVAPAVQSARVATSAVRKAAPKAVDSMTIQANNVTVSKEDK